MTQLLFTLCFMGMLVACILVPGYILCIGPEHHRFVLLIRVLG